MGAFWLSWIAVGIRNAPFLDAFQNPFYLCPDYSPEAISTGRTSWQHVRTSFHQTFQPSD